MPLTCSCDTDAGWQYKEFDVHETEGPLYFRSLQVQIDLDLSIYFNP